MCGIFGVIGTSRAAQNVLVGLDALQHRGQDACGIVSYDGKDFHREKGKGLVSRIFQDRSLLEGLVGNAAIGHTRYRTAGGTTESNFQPQRTRDGSGVAMAHNGNVEDIEEMRLRLMALGKKMDSSSDLEVLMLTFANYLKNERETHRIFQAVENLMHDSPPSYSVVTLIADRGLLAFRDPWGVRPLVIGSKSTEEGEVYAFASETIALTAAKFDVGRPVRPGEAIFIDNEGNIHEKVIMQHDTMHCMFEHVYFARPESQIEERYTYETRERLGIELAQQVRDIEIDVVFAVPDTARPSASAMARELGVEYREGLFKNRYGNAVRTFIEPGQEHRDDLVRSKYHANPPVVNGKRVMVVDDSIVRGTTLTHIVQLLRDAGAQEVHVASTSPPQIAPCYTGIATPTFDELIAYGKSTDEVGKETNVDSLTYISIDGLKRAIDLGNNLCLGCVGGQNPVPELYQIRRPK